MRRHHRLARYTYVLYIKFADRNAACADDGLCMRPAHTSSFKQSIRSTSAPRIFAMSIPGFDTWGRRVCRTCWVAEVLDGVYSVIVFPPRGRVQAKLPRTKVGRESVDAFSPVRAPNSGREVARIHSSPPVPASRMLLAAASIPAGHA